MGNVEDFFEKKRNWSILKNETLDKYLTLYIAKILATRKPLTIVDCFAGKGKFGDEKLGSPLIIAEHIKTRLEKYPNDNIRGIYLL
jgi:hypothetical protein